jgi:hypothetical protein
MGQCCAMPSKISQWEVRRIGKEGEGRPPKVELSRSYEFSRVPTSDSTAMLGIVCTIENAGFFASTSSEPSRLSINRRLRIFFRPLRLSHKTPFTVELFTTDRLEGGKFDVRASPIENDTVLFAEIGRNREDAATLLDAIASGKDMTFSLAYNSEPLVQFHLQNDAEFRRLCEETYNQFADFEIRKARLRGHQHRSS